MSAKFYICDHCGNLITTLHDAGVPMLCCGEKLRELIPNTVEASGEKHLPVVERSGSTLTVTVAVPAAGGAVLRKPAGRALRDHAGTGRPGRAGGAFGG